MENKTDDLRVGVKTKQELIKKLEDHIVKMDSVKNDTSIDRLKYLDLAKKILERVKKDFFPEPLPDGWEFIAEINKEEAFIFLQLIKFEKKMKEKDKNYEYTILQIFKLEEVSFK